MSEIRCANCGVIIHKRDIKRNKCWDCGNPPLTEDMVKTQEKEKRRQEKEKQESLEQKETERKELENRTLSEKFGFLSAFQGLIVLSMFIYTGMYLYGLPDSLKISDTIDDYTLVIISTVSFLLFLFNSVCIYSIVNFLFKLDKTKSDKE